MLSALKMDQCCTVHGTASLSRFGQSFCNVPTYTTPFGGEFRQATWSIISGVRVRACFCWAAEPHSAEHVSRFDAHVAGCSENFHQGLRTTMGERSSARLVSDKTVLS